MVLHKGGDYREMISGIGPSPAISEPAKTVPEKKEWLTSHPFLVTTIGVGGLILLGLFLVAGRMDVRPSNTSGAWGGAGGGFFSTTRRAAPVQTDPDDARLQVPDDSYATIPIFTPTEENPAAAQNDEDFMTVLAGLVKATPVTSARPQDSTPEGYSFIPQGLVSADPPAKKSTAQQAALRAYGNEVGTYVKAHEDTHTNAPQIMKDHIEGRADAVKQRALRNLGEDMEQLGIALRDMEVHPLAAGMHKAYANAYITAGTNLMKIADTNTDEEFVSAITTYNASSESLSNQFQLLVILFGMNEVTFSSSDPGNIFTFNPNLSLSQ